MASKFVKLYSVQSTDYDHGQNDQKHTTKESMKFILIVVEEEIKKQSSTNIV